MFRMVKSSLVRYVLRWFSAPIDPMDTLYLPSRHQQKVGSQPGNCPGTDIFLHHIMIEIHESYKCANNIKQSYMSYSYIDIDSYRLSTINTASGGWIIIRPLIEAQQKTFSWKNRRWSPKKIDRIIGSDVLSSTKSEAVSRRPDLERNTLPSGNVDHSYLKKNGTWNRWYTHQKWWIFP